MKKTAVLKLFSVFFISAMLLTSCSKNNDDGTPENEGDTAGDYFPLALNNTWSYDFSAGDDQQINLYSTVTFGGDSYFVTDGMNPIDGSSLTQGYRKSGAVYYCYNDEMTFDYMGLGQIVMAPVSFTIFKDDLEVGESVVTETSSSTQIINQFTGAINTSTSMTFTTTVMEKGSTVIVNGVTYEDVIKVQLDAQASVLTNNYNGTITYYFAKNVGPVKLQTIAGEYSLVTYQLN